MGTGLHLLDGAIRTAQIPRVFRAFAISVRSIYLLMVISGLAIGGWGLLEIFTGRGRLDGESLVIIGFLLAYFWPAARAGIRLVRFRELVPDAHLRERPVIAAVVTIPAVVGILLLNLVLHVWIEIQPWGAEDVGGPLAGAVMLAVLLHVFALVTGEIVLVGRTRPAATLRPDPVC